MNIDLEKIREYFYEDCFAEKNGILIDSITEDRVLCSLKLTRHHRNSAGGVHGGAIFTLADLAFAVHCNLAHLCGEDASITVAQSCSISFIKSTKGSRLFAESACLSKGRNISVYRISVKDDLGVLIAEMLANGMTKVI